MMYLNRFKKFVSHAIRIDFNVTKRLQEKQSKNKNFFIFRITGNALKEKVTYTSRKLLRIKVTPDLHLTYRKNGGKPGFGIENEKYSLYLNFIDKTCK